MLGLKWLAGANITTFACGEISFASRLAVPMTRDLSRGLPLFEAVRVKCFQAIHHSSVDVARGLALLFGIGTTALPSWDSRIRWNNLYRGPAVR
jgi:hypothetical protein